MPKQPKTDATAAPSGKPRAARAKPTVQPPVQPPVSEAVAPATAPEPAAVIDAADAHRAGFVALVGRPNVGKSTLLNALVGEKVAIVSPRPQTTRRRILGIRSTLGAQAIFVDTPGIHEPTSALGRSMVKAARGAIPDADLVVWVVDVSRLPGDLDRRVAGMIRKAGRPTLVAMNKSDHLRPEHIAENTEAYRALVEPVDWILTIATEGHNLDRLWESIVHGLPAGHAFYPEDQLTDQTDRMLVAELVREAALTYLQEEVPHGIEVVVEGWERREDGLLRIAAKLYVEREGHKAIVIGRGGSMLKQIGSAARREIEKLLDEHVFLELFVAARPDWRKSAADVKRLGF